MIQRIAVLAALVVALGAAIGAHETQAQETIVPADYSATVDNPYFPISTFQTATFEGSEEDPDTGDTIKTRVQFTVLPDVKTVGGVRVQVVRDDAYEDGELVESTLDYFAQHKDGTVYYFGEDVDNYENGQLKDHDGSWLAGVGQNLPGVFMPATPVAGQKFDQERAPSIAEDHSTVLEVGLALTVPAGSYTNCIKTEDVNPLDPAAHVENKWYCTGAGFVRETAPDGTVLELTSITKAPVPAPAATATAPASLGRPIAAPAAGTGDDGTADDVLWIALTAALAFAGGSAAAWGVARRHG
jgi:hypothetical protein